MSDGDNATLGRPRAPDDIEWAAQTVRPTRDSAPWERWQPSPRHAVRLSHRAVQPQAGPTEGVTDEADADGGCHTGGGLTVAELTAKFGNSVPAPRRRRHAAPEPESLNDDVADEPDDQQDTEVIPIPLAYANRLPELHPTRREYTAVSGVPPARLGRPRTAGAPASKPKPRHHPMLVARRSAVALVALLSLLLTGGAWQWSASKNKSLNTVNALDPHSGDIVDAHAQFGDENFLIVGVDTRAGQNSAMGAGGTDDAGGARSDTVMLVNIPANRKRVVAVSFPRDLAITPIRCEAWNSDTGAYGPLYYEETGTYGQRYVYTETKLNSAFAFGGPKCLVKVIQKISGLSINRFMAIDFAGFAKMVDALGGVEVCSTTALEDYELGTVLDRPGHRVVDGQTALNYVRARQVTTEFNGDYGRIKRQQLFLSSLLRSLISKDTFFSLSKLNNVVDMFIGDSYVDNIKTRDLVDLGQSVQGVSAGHITFVTVPTGETDENGDEPPRTDDMQALFQAVIDDEPLPGEADQDAASTPTATSTTSDTPTPDATAESQGGAAVQEVTTAPQNVTVQVSNATGESGLATIATEELEQHGFNVRNPDDYPSTLKSTTVLFSSGNEQAAATVASAFANSRIERVPGKGQVVQVVLGPDFHSVTAPSPSGTSVSVHIARHSSGVPTALPEDLTVTNAGDTTCE